MQLYQPIRNISYEKDTSLNFKIVFKTPKNIEKMLKTSCYDCHSNHTNYPWYSYIQPVAWIMANHINEGKKELNFSEFGNYSNRRQKSKLKSIAGQIKSDEMPLKSYRILLSNAILSKENKAVLITWMEQTKDGLSKIN